MEPTCHGDRNSCSTRREISSQAKELCITFHSGIGIAYVTTIWNRHSKTVDRALVSRNFVLGLKFCPGACVLVHRLSYPLGQTRIFICPGIETACEAPIRNRHFDPVGWMRIFVRPGIGTAREAPIQNRHFDPVGTRSHSEISGPAPKFRSGNMLAGCRCDRIRTPIRLNRHNFPLGYQNHL
ncbi:hypothetical protein Taro_024739 [Colocasia esculenta]|uniref:Uncharacterized protein n=1 Tax=Colocasia esculenta TaxID=4460 RepID=A0A843V726_COLES|nr:hypothetical protein [Colocasia esculenta]